MTKLKQFDLREKMKFFTGKSLEKTKGRAGLLFVLPFVLGFLLIYLPIILDSICFSFFYIKNVRGGGYELIFKGFEYYNEALFGAGGSQFVQKLIAGLQQLVFDVPVILIFSLFIAVVLNQKMLGRAAFRAIFFIPVILSTGLMESINAADITSDYMGSEEGTANGAGESTSQQLVSAMDIQALFANMKVGAEIVTFVTSAVNNIYDIINRCGVQMLIFLSGLQAISPAIYEACRIDGASGWETFWKITFPMISPMILVNAVYTIIDSFTSASNVVMSYIYDIYESNQSLATAMSWIYFLMIILIIAVFALVASSMIFYQKRD